MHLFILGLHSWLRWFFLLAIVITLYRAYTGWLGKKPFIKSDNTLRVVTASLAHLQLLVGVVLYFVSPLIQSFMQDFPASMKDRVVRYFGMEHNVMMLIAIVVLTIGSARAKRKGEDLAKFKTIAIWFTIALVIILFAIPWPFSPGIGRPYFRGF